MILDRLKRLEVDVWFSYNGMSYGCECLIDECSNDSITVHVKYCQNLEVFYQILPNFFKSNFKCLQSEIRIYFPSKFAKALNSGQKITLITTSTPIILQEQLHNIQIKFMNLSGISLKHEQKWRNILSYEFKSGFEYL